MVDGSSPWKCQNCLKLAAAFKSVRTQDLYRLQLDCLWPRYDPFTCAIKISGSCMYPVLLFNAMFEYNHHHPFALFGDEFFRWVMGPLLVCWGLWNAPVLLDVVNFITWIISTITYRNPKHKMKHCCVKISQFPDANMFNMKCWLYDGNNLDLLKLSNYQSCPTSSHLRLWCGMAWWYHHESIMMMISSLNVLISVTI